MKVTGKLFTSSLVAASVFTASLAVAPAATAQDYLNETAEQREARCAKQKPPKTPMQMGQSFYRKYEKTEDMIAEKRYSDAENVMNGLLASSKTNDYERTVAYNGLANIAFEKDDMPGAISALEKVLSYKAVLRPKQEVQLLINLAQLYSSEDQPKKSLEMLAEWEPKAYSTCSIISAAQLAFAGQMHYTQENYDLALNYINRAIKVAEEDPGIEPREDWYGLVVAAHWEQGQFREAREVLEILVFNYPKKKYWMMMTQAYMELEDEKTAFAILESLYRSGMLEDDPAQLVNVANILMGQDTPVRAAWLLEKADENDQLDADKEETNMKLLGGAYSNAREYKKALPYLIRAAEAGEDARLWFQIGQVQYSLDMLTESLTSFDNALKMAKGSDERTRSMKFSVYMQKGNVLTSLERFKPARDALSEAAKLAKSSRDRRALANWRNYIKAEEARVEMLTGR